MRGRVPLPPTDQRGELLIDATSKLHPLKSAHPLLFLARLRLAPFL
jgi:hypothetical protein